MVRINCTVYEKYDFLKILDYAEKKKQEEHKKRKITKKALLLELETINKLRDRVNGKYKEDYQEIASKTYRHKGNSEEIFNEMRNTYKSG